MLSLLLLYNISIIIIRKNDTEQVVTSTSNVSTGGGLYNVTRWITFTLNRNHHLATINIRIIHGALPHGYTVRSDPLNVKCKYISNIDVIAST